MWEKDGLLHRDGDEPAVIHTDGTREWWVSGQLHRNSDKPAVTRTDGHLEWWVHGQRRRDGDKPAIVESDGSLHWFVHNKRVRATGRGPITIYADGHHVFGLNLSGQFVTQFASFTPRYAFVAAYIRMSMQ